MRSKLKKHNSSKQRLKLKSHGSQSKKQKSYKLGLKSNKRGFKPNKQKSQQRDLSSEKWGLKFKKSGLQSKSWNLNQKKRKLKFKKPNLRFKKPESSFNKPSSQSKKTESKANQLRLNKFLAEQKGISRRQADELIQKGRVFVNHKKVSQLAVFVDSTKDEVQVKKQRISFKKIQPVYYMLNKPTKVLTTREDPKGRPTVMDYMPKSKTRLFPVGRLDWDSEGLLILTNDGDFADKILHPKHKICKTYLVKVRGRPKVAQISKLTKGVSTPFGKKRALFAKMFSKKTSNAWVKVIISEGKNRQIRWMFDKLGFSVIKLRRTAIGRLKMSKLAKGFCVKLKDQDVNKIFQKPKELKKF